MPSKSAKVEAFFSDPDPYLRNNCAIAVRSTLVKDLLGEIRHSRILDLGCGDGSVSVHFLAQRNSVTMLDLSWAMLERARANTPPEYRSRVDYVNADLLDFEAERPYDVVLCIGVLAHVESIEETIAKVADLLRVGGRCVVQITDSNRGLGRLHYLYYSARASLTGSIGYSLNETTLPQIISMAACNCLELTSIRRHSLLLPGMGKLPARWLLKYELFVLRSRILSRYGASALLLFEKTA